MFALAVVSCANYSRQTRRSQILINNRSKHEQFTRTDSPRGRAGTHRVIKGHNQKVFARLETEKNIDALLDSSFMEILKEGASLNAWVNVFGKED